MKATLLGSLFLAASVSLAAADVAVDRSILRTTFESLSASDRRQVQQMMQDAGLYQSTVDGIYGQGTETAAIRTAKFLEENSHGRLGFNLATRGEVAAFLNFLRSDQAPAWLWGEGGECDC